MLGVGAPGAHSLLVLELDDGDTFAVVGKKSFVRDVAGHRPRDGGNLFHQRDIFLADARTQTRTKNSDDHGGGSLSSLGILPISVTQDCAERNHIWFRG